MELEKTKILNISVNQLQSHIGIGTEKGYQIYKIDPLEFKKEVSILIIY